MLVFSLVLRLLDSIIKYNISNNHIIISSCSWPQRSALQFYAKKTSNNSCDYSHVSQRPVLHGITTHVAPSTCCRLQILARALEKSVWQPKWWGSLAEWIMDNLWVPLGGRSHMTMIILSYKPSVPERLWLRKSPSLLSSKPCPPPAQTEPYCLSFEHAFSVI